MLLSFSIEDSVEKRGNHPNLDDGGYTVDFEKAITPEGILYVRFGESVREGCC